jgi:hypothetical protein
MQHRKPSLAAAACIAVAALAGVALAGAVPAAQAGTGDGAWTFAVSGDSRNCGDVVMPSIAAGARIDKAVFYWHLGDLRAIHDIDEDFRAQHPKAGMSDYLAGAWLDFERNQIEAFGALPFYLGIGNHETIAPKTREEFLSTFAAWLDAPSIREQRLLDDPRDHTLRAYYHWLRDGIDFITLDNATPDEFDAAQLAWLRRVLQQDQRDSAVRAVVVGMHEALPEGLARGHSMSDVPDMQSAGLQAYQELLGLHRTKPVYVLASHSHFVMENAYNSAYWQEHGGVLPGWIIGTAGAVRYPLPPAASHAGFARTHVYGYLLATVAAPGKDDRDPVRFEFREVTEGAVPPDVVQRFGSELVHFCYRDNAR